MKINLDKYYTPTDLAEYCVNKTKEVIGVENITEWLEPSAGAGVFLPYLDNNYLAFDIEPEAENIEQKNYLELDLPYFKGRCVIGNPPFGTRNTLSVKFFKQAITQGDYVAFILPISQYNNNQQMYEFDLVHSEELPLIEYSGVKILCCLNIYKRPIKGLNKKAISYKLKDVFVGEYRRGGTYKKPDVFDFAMNTYGTSLGKEVDLIGTFCQENYIVVKNETYREEIINVMRSTDWKNLYPFISSPKIQTWKIYKYLKEKIPTLT